MIDSILTGLFTLLGAVAGGLLTFYGNKKLVRYEEAKKEMLKLSNQIISYWQLEKEYCAEVSKLTNKQPKTVLEEFRKRVQENNFDRPIMTENEIKRLILKWNLQ